MTSTLSAGSSCHAGRASGAHLLTQAWVLAETHFERGRGKTRTGRTPPTHSAVMGPLRLCWDMSVFAPMGHAPYPSTVSPTCPSLPAAMEALHLPWHCAARVSFALATGCSLCFSLSQTRSTRKGRHAVATTVSCLSTTRLPRCCPVLSSGLALTFQKKDRGAATPEQTHGEGARQSAATGCTACRGRGHNSDAS